MAAPPPRQPRSRFGELLQTKLDANRATGRKPDSLRSLSRVLGEGDDVRSENARRNLGRWVMGPTVPNPESRRQVAGALGIDPSELGDDDDEEADGLAATLALAIREVLAVELAKGRAA